MCTLLEARQSDLHYSRIVPFYLHFQIQDLIFETCSCFLNCGDELPGLDLAPFPAERSSDGAAASDLLYRAPCSPTPLF